jgi:hypothetical protein
VAQKKEPSLSNDFRDFKKSFQYSDAELLKQQELVKLYEEEFEATRKKPGLYSVLMLGMRISDYNSFSEEDIQGQMIVHTLKRQIKNFYVHILMLTSSGRYMLLSK